MSEIKIANVSTKDEIKSVVDLADIIWHEHYTPIIGVEQVEYMLEKFQTKNAITNQIRKGTFYYLMLLDQEPVGYLSFYPKNGSLFLSKIYVRDEFRGKGIGKSGMKFVEDQSKKLGHDKVTLTVNKHNKDSILAYEKLGFKKTESTVMDIGGGFVMDDYVMKKTIRQSE